MNPEIVEEMMRDIAVLKLEEPPKGTVSWLGYSSFIEREGIDMITIVGIYAGQIWNCLEAHGGSLSLRTLFSEIDTSKEIACMALGWLVRGGYVLMHGSDFSNSTLCLKSVGKDGNDSAF